MANPDTPNGLNAASRIGTGLSGQGNLYYIPATDGTAMAVGDPVTLAGSGDADGVPAIARLTAGAPTTGAGYMPVGFIVGFKVSPSALEVADYRAASTERYALVCDDPEIEFVVQEDSDGGALAVTQIGQGINFIMGTPSAVTGLSNVEIDSSSAGVSADKQARIVRLLNTPNNAVGTNAKWVCKFQQHQYAINNAGV